MTELLGQHWWVLRDREPVKVTFREYSDWMMRGFEETRRVAETFVGEARVSTVFLSVDHNWAGGSPILFETMVFGGPEEWDGWQERYSTWEEAMGGHKRIVAALENGEPDPATPPSKKVGP